LKGRQLAIVDSGIDGGKDKLHGREQAVILYDDEMNVTVVQPNEDGSYWRKIVRNKVRTNARDNILYPLFMSEYSEAQFDD
jgi:hypothetical protein